MPADFLFHLIQILEGTFGAKFATPLFYEFLLLPVFVASIVCRLAMMLFLGEARGYPVVWLTTALLLCALVFAGAISNAWIDPYVKNVSIQSVGCCILLCIAFAIMIPVAKFLLALRTLEAGAFLLLICFATGLANFGMRYAHEKKYDAMIGEAFSEMVRDFIKFRTIEVPQERKQ